MQKYILRQLLFILTYLRYYQSLFFSFTIIVVFLDVAESVFYVHNADMNSHAMKIHNADVTWVLHNLR